MAFSTKPEYHIVVVGGYGVGKSCLISRLLRNYFLNEHDPTIEDSYRMQCTIDDTSALLDVLDTGSQAEYDAVRNQHIRDREGFVLVYSITSRQSFTDIVSLQQQILLVKDGIYSPVVVVGNKCDLEEEREVTAQEGEALARSFGCSFIETSAKTNRNVEAAFYNTVREIRRQRCEMQISSTGHSSMLGTNPTKYPIDLAERNMKKTCCSTCTIM